jgi:hypothetical protein
MDDKLLTNSRLRVSVFSVVCTYVIDFEGVLLYVRIGPRYGRVLMFVDLV